jgi:dienelactone hydrolase
MVPRTQARRYFAIVLAVTCLAGAAACAARAGDRASGRRGPSAAAPVGADTLAGVEWLRVPVPAGGTLAAAVARPAGAGPHPVVVLLHGTHGFASEYVGLAHDLAREAGVVAVTGCWFVGRRGVGTQFVTPIECPEAPPMPVTGLTPEALAVVSALVDAARALPGVRTDRVALFGHSRGGVAALNYALERGRLENGLRAVVLNSAAYPPELVSRAAELGVPALMLHGTADSPAQGGSANTAATRARAFEAALLAAGKVVEARYFEGADHNTLFMDAEQRARSVRHMAEFLRRQGFE